MVFDGFWMVFVCWVRCDLAIRDAKAPSGPSTVHLRRIDDLQPSEWFREKRGFLSELRDHGFQVAGLSVYFELIPKLYNLILVL